MNGQPDTTSQPERPVPGASRVLLACVVASCAPLALNTNGRVTPPFALSSSATPNLSMVAAALVPLLVLVGWRLAPARSWQWLLLLGAVAAVPWLLARQEPELYADGLGQALAVVGYAAPSLIIVGALGAGVWLWQVGSRTAAVALIASMPVLQLLGPVDTLSALAGQPSLVGPVGTVLVGLAVLGAAGAVLLCRDARVLGGVTAPGWPLVVVGGLAAGSPALLLVGLLLSDSVNDDILLHIGLAGLVVGVLIAAVFGRRVLLGSLVVGLLLGTFGALVLPFLQTFSAARDVAVLIVLGGMAIGVAAALSRWRAQVGVIGLGVTCVLLQVGYLLYNQDEPVAADNPFRTVAVPVLLPIAIAATMAVFGTVGAGLAERGQTPAVLIGLSIPTADAMMFLVTYLGRNQPETRSPLVGTLPSVLMCLLTTLVLFGLFVFWTHRSRTRRPSGDDAEPVESGRQPG